MSTKKRGKKQHKADTGSRQERVLKAVAYLTIWDLTLTVLLTNVQLILFGEADMLNPFKALILTGFVFWLFNSFFSVYFHYAEARTRKKLEKPISLCVKIVSGLASIGAMIYAIPSALMLQAILYLNITFDAPTLLAFAVGIFAAVIGLLLTIYQAREFLKEEL